MEGTCISSFFYHLNRSNLLGEGFILARGSVNSVHHGGHGMAWVLSPP